MSKYEWKPFYHPDHDSEFRERMVRRVKTPTLLNLTISAGPAAPNQEPEETRLSALISWVNSDGWAMAHRRFEIVLRAWMIIDGLEMQLGRYRLSASDENCHGNPEHIGRKGDDGWRRADYQFLIKKPDGSLTQFSDSEDDANAICDALLASGFSEAKWRSHSGLPAGVANLHPSKERAAS